MDENESTQHARIEYVPPVKTPDYITGTFDMLAVAQLVMWADAVKEEFTMPEAVEAIIEGFKEAYQGELPSVYAQPKDDVEGGALV